MELKHLHEPPAVIGHPSLNRTKMELKLRHALRFRQSTGCLNRTKMELKLICCHDNARGEQGLNRTKMELKPRYIGTDDGTTRTS